MVDSYDKFLFLDIDGVLNNTNHKESDSPLTYPGSAFSKDNVDAFNKLLEDIPDIQVIICSSWRFDSNLQTIFDYVGIKCHIEGITPCLTYSYSQEGYSRGDEVKQWLNSCPSKNYRYCILDDCNDYRDEQEPYLVLLDERKGFRMEDIEKVKKILNE